MKKINFRFLLFFISLQVFFISEFYPQQNFTTHTRGKLWETLYNWGFIGDPGAWDYNQITGIGFYPGFSGYTFPNNEIDANGFITDANFHNFKTGPWIIAKNALELQPPDYSPKPADFLIYHSSLSTGVNGIVPGSIKPFELVNNFNGSETFNPLVPEETNYVEFHTSTGITVKQRSMAWSFPGYDDFIIYDYTFVNTGQMAIPPINNVLPLQQTLNEVWLVFHSGIQASTKGMINFHYNDDFESSAAPAGAFGWHPDGYSDFYVVENDQLDGKGLLYYSRDFNGGREPVAWDNYGIKNNWQNLLRLRPEWNPELQDPSAFGFVFLYRTPPPGSNGDPFEPDPTFFNIYSDEASQFNGKTVDFESFGLNAFGKEGIYNFARHSARPPESTNGRLYNWYTSSFGPYNLAPGDSVRLILAEIAGVMDLKEVIKGDPDHYFPDSTIADIRRNAEAVRNAVRWGFGAVVDGVNLAADVPEPPPAPNCSASNVSAGSDTAIIAVRWDKLSEETNIVDGSGNVFYEGSTDLSGYRIFRGNDKRGIWDQIADIPGSDLNNYWNAEINQYEYLDKDLQFGFEYYYYVQAYNAVPKQWTSANGTVVQNLPELVSPDLNRTELTGAKPGPVSLDNGWDVFVAPNPYIEGDINRSFSIEMDKDAYYKIEFRNLPERAVIKIFNIAGDLIKTLRHGPDSFGNLSGSIAWNQRSESGLLVAPGLYLYVVESDTKDSMGSRTKGKLMIIR